MEEEESKWKIKVEESQKELKQVFLKMVFSRQPSSFCLKSQRMSERCEGRCGTAVAAGFDVCRQQKKKVKSATSIIGVIPPTTIVFLVL